MKTIYLDRSELRGVLQPRLNKTTCTECNGDGYIDHGDVSNEGYADSVMVTDCPQCKGTGEILVRTYADHEGDCDWINCPNCGGNGWVKNNG